MIVLQEALRTFAEQAVKAAGAQQKFAIVPAGQFEPAHVYYTVGEDGTATRVESSPRPRAHKLATVAEVLDFVERKGTEQGSVIWYDRDYVTVIVDDSTRRDHAQVNLTFTPQFAMLLSLEKRRAFKQKDFVRLLRVELAGTQQDSRLLDWVRSVRFTSQGTAAGQVRHGRESMGRDLDAAVTSELADECPEEITLLVRVYDDPVMTTRSKVVCAVEIEPASEEFSLTPLPLELHNAIEDQVERIGSDFREGAKCPVFRGNAQ